MHLEKYFTNKSQQFWKENNETFSKMEKSDRAE